MYDMHLNILGLFTADIDNLQLWLRIVTEYRSEKSKVRLRIVTEYRSEVSRVRLRIVTEHLRKGTKVP